MTQFFKNLATSFGLSIVLALPIAITGNAQALGDFNLLGISTFQELIQLIIGFLRGLAVPLATLVIIWGGYLYFLGGFDQKANGRRAIESAVLGLCLIFGVDFIIQIAQNTVTDQGISFEFIEKQIQGLSTQLTSIAAFVAILVIIWGGYQYFFSDVPGMKTNGKQTIINGILGLVAILLADPIIKLVQSIIPDGTSDVSALNSNAVIDFIVNLLRNFFIPISAFVTIVFFIIGGYYYLTSGGDDGKAKKGMSYIRNAVIGLVIILTSFTLVQLLVYIVNGLNIGR
jgi:hypothetical protein